MRVAVIDAYGGGAVYEIDEEWTTAREIKEKGRLLCYFSSNTTEE